MQLATQEVAMLLCHFSCFQCRQELSCRCYLSSLQLPRSIGVFCCKYTIQGNYSENGVSNIDLLCKGGGGRGLSRLDLTVGRFFFLSFGKMSSGWETVEIN